ncbi:MAG TPA: hypothetical protein PK264_06570 [Hyphomicrobiaceae bacterium]|nr:hypothetical protein [Hyphomicrobiaceae bacterium]
MLAVFAIGIAAGLTSAILFISAASGSLELGSLLLLVVPLPIMLAGLGWGLTPMAVAAIVGGLSVLTAFRERVMAGTVPARLPGGYIQSIRDIPAYEFLLTQALPAMILAHLAMLARLERPTEGDEARIDWYPLGRIVAVASVLAGAVASWRLLSFGTTVETITANIKALFGRLFTIRVPGMPSQPLSAADMDALTSKIVAMLPIGLAVMWLLGMLINLWLAGRITLASGRLLRPWPEFSLIAMPNGFAFAFVGAILATWLGGLPGFFAVAFAGVIAAAFAMTGLAIVHRKTTGNSWRSFILAGTYAFLVIGNVTAVVILALVALAEPMAPWNRNRLPPAPPA